MCTNPLRKTGTGSMCGSISSASACWCITGDGWNAMANIIVFDGVCHLCNGWVQFLLRHDRRERFLFAPMQGEAGRRLLEEHGLNPADPVSFLYVGDGVAHTDSDAALRVLMQLGGIWRGAAIGYCVPRRLRDALYRTVARHRYRLFGKRDNCMLPPAGA